ncbi:DUF4369 domain-containing protein [Winogradskyella sp.]|jgi:thiol-disulfide isomerase/thioredoxin|uniref:DUF4369 domain-containing protein n=1 Tax=Winogradskyella sp. TaxID=1883156 RepID=UPI0025FAA9C1|nr:DUF4369 domain-containing protein [Winogradskyella sp.]MCT4629569.1 DUF4369 domain-containing protein [Winogradskyella sp.]
MTTYIKILIGLLVATVLNSTPNEGRFSINGNISGFEDGTKVMLLNAQNNIVLDTSVVKANRFTFLGETTSEPQSYVLYIPIENNMKYTYLFMADEDVFVEGDINDFPNNLTVTGSVHHNLKVAYDKRIADYDKELTVHKSKIAELQQQNLWNDSLQQKYIGENGILREINAKKTEVEKQFIADHIDTYYAMQILYYKKSNYKDRKLKKIFSKFSKELQSTKNGKAIQAYLNNPEIKKGEKYTDFEALSRDGSIKKLSEQFDGKKYVLLDFSTPTCPHSQKAIPMLQDLNEKYKEDLNIVTFYTESKQEHFDYISNLEKNTWQFLWTKEGEEGFPYKRYRINSTPTYYLFSLEGKLIEKWSGFQQGYYDATQSKIEKLIGVK